MMALACIVVAAVEVGLITGGVLAPWLAGAVFAAAFAAGYTWERP